MPASDTQATFPTGIRRRYVGLSFMFLLVLNDGRQPHRNRFMCPLFDIFQRKLGGW